MSISVDEERRFYDAQYEPFLALPDDQLAVNREILLRTLHDPRQPVYERRRMYLAAFEKLVAMPLAQMQVLDYGCGPADWGVWLATEGARVTLLDVSPKAIQLGLKRAAASGVAARVRGVAGDASDLSCFRDEEFDLVFASAALHHTLKYPHALEELVRVIRPAGWLVLAETYGNNPLLNAARRLRAWWQNEPREQGEEILFSQREVALLKLQFRSVSIHEFNLFAMSKRLFRGQFHHRSVQFLVALFERLDQVLLTAFPAARRYCGELLLVAQK
ncbi:MAG: class I SAM-dependent methyltransferase [Bryobacteraceae bacterium]|nr:class I SAM-dependent methyltransferase [Bryobacteraceae bacterium]MDW8379897.1 class I SAM-dependent methyltransferase [Bryobacterales bacterium]